MVGQGLSSTQEGAEVEALGGRGDVEKLLNGIFHVFNGGPGLDCERPFPALVKVLHKDFEVNPTVGGLFALKLGVGTDSHVAFILVLLFSLVLDHDEDSPQINQQAIDL